MAANLRNTGMYAMPTFYLTVKFSFNIRLFSYVSELVSLLMVNSRVTNQAKRLQFIT